MRSGNGRHRRPRQAPAIFVTAGVTGAGLALPLLSAGGAHAADTTTWDRVAQCESGGVWSAASGNGFYGGLQLTQEMWDNHGGGAYASRPDLASRAQQIAVAQSILDDLGPDTWPSCAVNAGLTKGGRAPQVDPGGVSTQRPGPSNDGGDGDSQGSSDSSDAWGSSGGGLNDWQGDEQPDAKPSPSSPDDSADKDSRDKDSRDSGGSDSAGSGDSSRGPDRTHGPGDSTKPGDDGDGASRTDDPSHSRGPSHSADPSDGGSRTDTSGTPQEAPAKGKHRGDADDAEKDGGHAAGGRHASRGDDAHRTGPAADGTYTVRRGDSLSGIAQTHRLPGGWHALYERNEGVVGSDADLIQPGQLLDLGHPAG